MKPRGSGPIHHAPLGINDPPSSYEGEAPRGSTAAGVRKRTGLTLLHGP
jgi:hypothetical protein